MGSPISCDATCLLMDRILGIAKEKVHREIDFDIKVLQKYVDDMFIVAPSDFTCGKERDNTLPFLDMLIRRHANGTITTEWYQKPTASGRICNYKSFHPLKTKISTACGLIDRVVRLTSDATMQNIKHTVTNILLKNDYPKNLINRLCSKNHPSKMHPIHIHLKCIDPLRTKHIRENRSTHIKARK